MSSFARRALRDPRLLRLGRRFECPLCERSFARFHRVSGVPNVQCPGCGSRERQRGLWLYLQRRTDVLERPMRVLHFAPEDCLTERLRAIHGSTYLSGDLDGDVAMERIDITAIDKPAHAFDVVLVSHVLEHVPDDRLAMREIGRVLGPGGIAILQHPIDLSRPTTFEDWSITERRERSWRLASTTTCGSTDGTSRIACARAHSSSSASRSATTRTTGSVGGSP
jgi:SAM-dependent methyltransferase